MMKRASKEIGFLFIYGAGLERQVWERTAKELECPYLLADFPMRSEPYETRRELTLEDYSTHVRKQVNEWEVERFVIVAHSLGGVVAMQAASEFSDRLAGFIAVGAAIPKAGGSFLSTLPLPKRWMMSLILKKMGTKPPEKSIRAGLCNDLTEEDSARIVRRFVPESVRVYTDPVESSLPNVPKLYVKLDKDKAFSPALQDKMILRLAPNRVANLNAGHLPMLGDPVGLRRMLLEFLSELK
ncbi:alpha/beta hydrolase [Cohnella herbarum]|uniref:Alpha/beta hydrolase n=1 Tax=Cohnella herbarum TaxID=2728023 RepID=A0A7Z2VSJ4_9BACL|nr:alpha/beta hydrolase [Cohnella herbarum]